METEAETEAGARRAQRVLATPCIRTRSGEELTMGSVRDEFVAYRALAAWALRILRYVYTAVS